jgi:hypothetical protein
MVNNYKILVFDLDNTIGHFEEVGMFIDSLKHVYKSKISKKYIFNLLDLWPKVFRYKIFDIFKTIARVKNKNKNIKVVIYTNNLANRSWTINIIKYIEEKINCKLFDKVITANSKHNLRTSDDKIFNDLVKCIKYKNNNNNNTFIFFDDQYYPLMENENLEYLLVEPYIYTLKFEYMIDSFLKSKYNTFTKNDHDNKQFKKKMSDLLNSYETKKQKRFKICKIDERVYKKMNKSLNKFINLTKKKERINSPDRKTRMTKKYKK